MYPDKIALKDKYGSYSYHELDMISNGIAHFIVNECNNQGIDLEANIEAGKDGERIGILLPRKKLFVATLLGIIKAGCCVVNVNPEFPNQRKNYIIHDSNCRCIISSLDIDKTGIEGNIFDIEDIIGKDENYIKDPINLSNLENEGMIAYTSGSTGVSKGVVHRQKFFSISNLNCWQDFYEYTKDDNFACMTGFSFTIVYSELLTPIINGSTSYILDEEEKLDIPKIVNIIQNHGITVMSMPSKVLRYISKTYPDLSIKFVYSGGEKLQNIETNNFLVLENYGCSECGYVLSNLMKEDDSPRVLGKPGPFWKTYLVDEDGNEITESGVVGELCVSGEGVSKGYLNLPEATEEKYVDCPFSDDDIMFKTGDLMSLDENGLFEYHGRNDFMVNINGIRVELAEVEIVIQEDKAISEVVCTLENIHGGDNLVCYFATEHPIDDEKEFVSAIKDRIAEKLPDYMIPSIFVKLDKLPRNINGKIDRSNLPEIDVSAHKEEFEKPTSEFEILLANAFSKILSIDVEDISINDNFYDLGGNSVLTMELLDYLKMHEISSMDIFKGQSIKGIVNLVESKTSKNKENLSAREKEEMAKSHDLTPFQRRLLIDQSCEFNSTVWNIPFLFSLDEEVDAERLREALQKTIDNHQVLSTTLEIDGEAHIKQRYIENLLPKVAIEEMTEKELEDILPDLVVPFNIFGGPLARFRIFKTEKTCYLFMDIHHLIGDGTSSNIFYKDIVSAYRGEELPEDYYFSFIKDMEIIHESSDYEKAEKYYLGKYGDLSSWALSPSHDLSDEGYGVEITGIWPAGLSVEDIEKAEERFKTSRNVLAVVASLKALSAQSGNSKVLVNWVYNNRNNHDYDNTMGCLIKSLPVGLDLNDYENDEEILKEIKNQVINGIANSSYEYLSINYESFTTDTLFVNYLGKLRNSEGFQYFKPELMEVPRERDIAKMRVAIAVMEDENDEILTGVEYCSSMYSKENAVEFHELLNKEFISLVKEGG
ncbi:hypothetical protein TL18_07125 [Methanobrevibacter sp. YE315]|nr:hypothetical protein TL18_07125 [Methanobrevibacter sp. YE315]